MNSKQVFKAEQSWRGVSPFTNKREKMCTQGNIIMMHSLSVKDKGKTRECTECKAQQLALLGPANKREKISTRKYYHNALTICEGQRRNERVHSAKKRRVGCSVSHTCK